jgi:hypothetical protein
MTTLSSFAGEVAKYEALFADNSQVCIVCGEMNPIFYELLDELFERVLRKGLRIGMIGGPRIALRDKDYEKACDKDGTKKEGWWKYHPVTKYAKEGVPTADGKINRILLYKSKRRQRNHFVVGNVKDVCVFEAPHRELHERRAVLVENEHLLANALRGKVRKLLSSLDEVVRWNFDLIEFVRCSELLEQTESLCEY